MRTVRTFTGVLAAAMAATIAYGFIAGDFGEEGGAILDLAWGRVTLIDLYVGLALFGAWIVIREGWRRALPWLAGLIVLGSFGAAVYAFLAARKTDSVVEFLTGSR